MKGEIMMKKNVGTADQVVRIILGVILLALLFILDGGIKYVGLLGIVLILTGLLRFCPLYPLIGLNTDSKK